jgi:hypothetical protein
MIGERRVPIIVEHVVVPSSLASRYDLSLADVMVVPKLKKWQQRFLMQIN